MLPEPMARAIRRSIKQQWTVQDRDITAINQSALTSNTPTLTSTDTPDGAVTTAMPSDGRDESTSDSFLPFMASPLDIDPVAMDDTVYDDDELALLLQRQLEPPPAFTDSLRGRGD